MSMCSSSGSWSGTTKAWLIHGIVAGAAVAAAIGARFYLGQSRTFRSRVVGIIPARFASSRFEGKPLVQILGKPMIQVPIRFHVANLTCFRSYFYSFHLFQVFNNFLVSNWKWVPFDNNYIYMYIY